VLVLATGCANPAPKAAQSSPRAPGPGAAPARDAASARPAAATPEPEAVVQEPPASEQTDAGATTGCKPRGPALAERVCTDARLESLLAELGKSDGELDGFVRCEPLSVQDLEAPPTRSGQFGDLDQGNGFFGDGDVNRDGTRDLVLLYTSVDYWAWFVFVRHKDCLRFVDAVEGYQVELLPKLSNGVRDVRVLTYPLQGRLETRTFDGKRYAP
jgi:hypothetical protein